MNHSVYFESGSRSTSNDSGSESESEHALFSDEAQLRLPSLKSTRAALRAELLDPFNRLHSIHHDSQFVEGVSKILGLPLVANQRCGAWYVNPEKALPVHAYFKSTDGHTGQWDFNLRRSNLHLLKTIREQNSLIIVDSTRRGKRFPDALSKTIPIWCAVVNAAFLKRHPDYKGSKDDFGLTLSQEAVSRSEQHQIETRIDGWATDLLNSSYNLLSLDGLQKPLKPIFISPSTDLSQVYLSNEVYSIVCLSASQCLTMDQVAVERYYVQGSADDHELWSEGLTPAMFWENRIRLLEASRDALPGIVSSVVQAKSRSLYTASTPILITDTNLVLHSAAIEWLPSPSVLFCLSTESDQPLDQYRLGPGKNRKGLDSFFAAIPDLLDYLEKHADAPLDIGYTSTLESDGKDLMVALTLIHLVSKAGPDTLLNKQFIRNKLQIILESGQGTLNPSRSILKRVNEYFLSQRKARSK